MRQHETTWLVIADGERARILAAEPVNGRYRPIADYWSDGEAEVGQAVAPGVPPAPARDGLAKDLAIAPGPHSSFAHRIAASLNRAAKRRRFQALVLIAPSRTLHELLDGLDAPTLTMVTAELVKDLTAVPDQDLPHYLSAAWRV